MTISESGVLREAECALENATSGRPDTNLVVTAMRLKDGSYSVLSRFGDPVWRLPDTLFPSNVPEHRKSLNFHRIPAIFQFVLKVSVLRYYLYGLEGGGRPRGRTLHNFYMNATAFLQFLDTRGIDRLAQVNTLLTTQYAETCRSSISQQTDKRLGAVTLSRRFEAVETLHRLSCHTSDPMPHPWPETSAYVLSGGGDQSTWDGEDPCYPRGYSVRFVPPGSRLAGRRGAPARPPRCGCPMAVPRFVEKSHL